MKSLARRCLTVAAATAVAFTLGCEDGTGTVRPSPDGPQYSKGGSGQTTVGIESVTPPPDDCSVDPNGYRCTHEVTTDVGEYNGSCPDGCTTFPLTTTQRTGALGALQKIDTNNPSCVSLANTARGYLDQNRIQYYNDPDPNNSIYGDYGDAHYVPGNYDPWAKIHIASFNFTNNNSGGQLTMTLLHEAYHAGNGNPDEVAAEYWAQTCYKP
jgi:hypothetical protein